MQRARLFAPEISHCIPSSSLWMNRFAQPQAESSIRAHAMGARLCSLRSTPPELLAEHGFASAKQLLAASRRQRHEGARPAKQAKRVVQRLGVNHAPYQPWFNKDQAQGYPKPWQRIRRFEHRSALNSPFPAGQPIHWRQRKRSAYRDQWLFAIPLQVCPRNRLTPLTTEGVQSSWCLKILG